jgi:hypothetical protein
MAAYDSLPPLRLRRGTLQTSRAPVLVLESPFNPCFPPAARKLGGRWDGAHWLFDVRDEARVAALCERVYGINPLEGPPEVATVRVAIPEDETLDRELWGFGRLLVERRHAGDDVWLGAGVVILDGDFPLSGGSRRDPLIGRPKRAVTLEIRDVPVSLLAREKRPYTIVEDIATEDLSTERRIRAIVDQARSLSPAGRATLLLRLREVAVEGEL